MNKFYRFKINVEYKRMKTRNLGNGKKSNDSARG